jgi:hypothetical protein
MATLTFEAAIDALVLTRIALEDPDSGRVTPFPRVVCSGKVEFDSL